MIFNYFKQWICWQIYRIMEYFVYRRRKQEKHCKILFIFVISQVMLEWNTILFVQMRMAWESRIIKFNMEWEILQLVCFRLYFGHTVLNLPLSLSLSSFDKWYSIILQRLTLVYWITQIIEFIMCVHLRVLACERKEIFTITRKSAPARALFSPLFIPIHKSTDTRIAYDIVYILISLTLDILHLCWK